MKKILPLVFLLALASAIAVAQAPADVQQNQQNGPQRSATGQTTRREAQNDVPSSISGNADPTSIAPAGTQQASPTQPRETKSGAAQESTAPAANSSAQSSMASNGATAGSVDSATLKDQLDSAFQAEPSLTGSNIQVSVSDTTVDLTGTVPTRKQQTTATRIARSYSENRRVIDQLKIAGVANTTTNPK
jgi:osmotically-inducible protein OsmY